MISPTGLVSRAWRPFRPDPLYFTYQNEHPFNRPCVPRVAALLAEAAPKCPFRRGENALLSFRRGEKAGSRPIWVKRRSDRPSRRGAGEKHASRLGETAKIGQRKAKIGERCKKCCVFFSDWSRSGRFAEARSKKMAGTSAKRPIRAPFCRDWHRTGRFA